MIQIFSIRGIPVRVDLGWLLVFSLVAWSLASGYFPHVLPDRSVAAYWVQGVLAATLLFGSVLLHELAHALVAVQHGVPVGGITLHVFGGVAQLESEPDTPRAELLIAAVGPLTSFTLAGAAWGLGRVVTGPPALETLATYVGAVNLVVGAFNLVPGFPLDGGRILRAALWWWTGRFESATRVATRIGSAFGLLTAAVGVVRAMAGDVLGGVWLVLIGLFVHQAARSTWELVRLRARLGPLRVEEVMSAAPVAIQADEPLADAVLASTDHVVAPHDSAWQAFLEISRHGLGRVAVVDAGTLVGVVSRRDLRQAAALEPLRRGVARRAA